MSTKMTKRINKKGNHKEECYKQRLIATGKVLYSANKTLRAKDALVNFSKALERFSSVEQAFIKLKQAIEAHLANS